MNWNAVKCIQKHSETDEHLNSVVVNLACEIFKFYKFKAFSFKFEIMLSSKIKQNTCKQI